MMSYAVQMKVYPNYAK